MPTFTTILNAFMQPLFKEHHLYLVLQVDLFSAITVVYLIPICISLAVTCIGN